MKIDLLDFGYLKYIEHWGSDERIIEAARMSTNKGFLGWGTEETPGDEKLLKYLWTNKHSTPFEMAGMVIEVQAPIMVFREWHRHRTQSYNEMSGRYTQMPDLHYIPELSRIQKQSKTNKQGSGESVPLDVALEFQHRMAVEQQMIYRNYEWALENGIAKELARLNTPVSRYSKMRASANLLNWLRFESLRLPSNAQYEIRVYAEALGDILSIHFPRTYDLFARELS